MVEKGDIIVGFFCIMIVVGSVYLAHVFGVWSDAKNLKEKGWEDKCKSYGIDKKLIGSNYFGYDYSYTVQYFCERTFINGSTVEYTYVEKDQTDPYCNRGISVCD